MVIQIQMYLRCAEQSCKLGPCQCLRIMKVDTLLSALRGKFVDLDSVVSSLPSIDEAT